MEVDDSVEEYTADEEEKKFVKEAEKEWKKNGMYMGVKVAKYKRPKKGDGILPSKKELAARKRKLLALEKRIEKEKKNKLKSKTGGSSTCSSNMRYAGSDSVASGVVSIRSMLAGGAQEDAEMGTMVRGSPDKAKKAAKQKVTQEEEELRVSRFFAEHTVKVHHYQGKSLAPGEEPQLLEIEVPNRFIR